MVHAVRCEPADASSGTKGRATYRNHLVATARVAAEAAAGWPVVPKFGGELLLGVWNAASKRKATRGARMCSGCWALLLRNHLCCPQPLHPTHPAPPTLQTTWDSVAWR